MEFLNIDSFENGEKRLTKTSNLWWHVDVAEFSNVSGFPGVCEYKSVDVVHSKIAEGNCK
jgi:hypothetical protein